MSNRERALKIMNDLYYETMGAASYTSPPSPVDYLEALEAAGLIVEYVELAPTNRFGVGGGKDYVTFSDNVQRVTIKIPHDLVKPITGAILVANEIGEAE